MTLAGQFTQIFRDEHRQVRDALLNLITTLQERAHRENLDLLVWSSQVRERPAQVPQ